MEDNCRSTLTLLAIFLIITVVGRVSVNGDYCHSNINNVTLEIVEGENACPYDPITIRCIVKKSPEALFLAWKCSNSSSGNNVLCGPIVNFTCGYGKVFSITGECQCDDDSIIVSEAKFLASRLGPKTLFCDNGMREDEKVISVAPRGLHTPKLSYKKILDDEGTVMIRLMWTTPDSTMKDIMYNLKIENSSFSKTSITKETHQDMIIYSGHYYNVTMFAERCNGTMTSSISTTTLFIQAQSEEERPIPAVNDDKGRPIEATNNSNTFPPWGIALAVIVPLFGICLLVIFILLCVLYIVRVRDTGSGKTMDGGENDTNDAVILGGREVFVTTRKKNKQNKSISALYVNDTHIYFTSHEDEDCLIYKYTTNGRHELGVKGFDHVHGIGGHRTEKDYFYVADNNCHVMKFNKKLKLVKMSKKYEYPFFGLVVTEMYVLICEEREYKIFVFDHDLEEYCTLQLSLPPTDITMYNDRYFVTARNAIIVLKIDFENKRLESESTINRYFIDSSPDIIQFNTNFELRSICVCNGKLLVVEKQNHLFCFTYSSSQLHLFAEDNCRPIAIATNGRKVYFSQERNNKCIISEIRFGSSARLSISHFATDGSSAHPEVTFATFSYRPVIR